MAEPAPAHSHLPGPGAVTGWEVVERAAQMAREGEEFALATVVWRMGPSSGQQGARAIVTADGQLFGWIGGACAEPLVLREAQRAILEREPRLLLLGTPEQFGGAVPDGIRVIPIACSSEGALEVFVEPVIPVPSVVVVGRSPMAQTLADMVTALGWRSRLVDWPEFTADQVDARSIVVVATQGHGDEEALQQAALARPAYLGLVASRRRGETVLGYLADRGTPAECSSACTYRPASTSAPPRTARSRSPSSRSSCSCARRGRCCRTTATLLSPPGTRACRARRTRGARGAAGLATAVDPVCGMTVPHRRVGPPVRATTA